jgi:hypothetical protein
MPAPCKSSFRVVKRVDHTLSQRMTRDLCAFAGNVRTAAPPFSTLSMPGLAGAAVAGADSAYSL